MEHHGMPLWRTGPKPGWGRGERKGQAEVVEAEEWCTATMMVSVNAMAQAAEVVAGA